MEARWQVCSIRKFYQAFRKKESTFMKNYVTKVRRMSHQVGRRQWLEVYLPLRAAKMSTPVLEKWASWCAAGRDPTALRNRLMWVVCTHTWGHVRSWPVLPLRAVSASMALLQLRSVLMLVEAGQTQQAHRLCCWDYEIFEIVCIGLVHESLLSGREFIVD